jgi:hypothetical protein
VVSGSCSFPGASAWSVASERDIGLGPRCAEGRLSSGAALVQGGSYVGFGLWSLLGRDHYRRTHRIRHDTWVLNAHGVWLITVGATLVLGAMRKGAIRPELRLLGAGSALGLAINDLVLLRHLPPIYRADLVYELAVAGAWLVPEERDGPADR